MATPAVSTLADPAVLPHPVPKKPFNILIMGPPGVGKSALASVYLFHTFPGFHYVRPERIFVAPPPPSSNFTQTTIFDTPNARLALTLRHPDAHATLLCFSLVDLASFAAARALMPQLSRFVLVGCKSDLARELYLEYDEVRAALGDDPEAARYAQMANEIVQCHREAEMLAEQWGIDFVTCSAREMWGDCDSSGIGEAFAAAWKVGLPGNGEVGDKKSKPGDDKKGKPGGDKKGKSSGRGSDGGAGGKKSKRWKFWRAVMF